MTTSKQLNLGGTERQLLMNQGGLWVPAYLVNFDIPDLTGTYQPRDSDLDAIAALATTGYGRSLLAVTNASDARSLLGAAADSGSVVAFSAIDHFLNVYTTAPSGTLGLALAVSGTAAAASVVPVANRPGVISFSTGTTTTGRSGYANAANALTNNGTQTYTAEFEFQIPIIPNATENFAIGLGFTQNLAFASSSNSVYLTCNTTNFQAQTKTGNISSVVNLIAIDTAWHNCKIAFNGTASTITLDGAATVIPTNMPTNATMQLFLSANKTAGTTARTMSVDFARFSIN